MIKMAHLQRIGLIGRVRQFLIASWTERHIYNDLLLYRVDSPLLLGAWLGGTNGKLNYCWELALRIFLWIYKIFVLFLVNVSYGLLL